MLLCPKCGNKLVREERVWRCQNNHSYDIAKRGYVNLALHHKALSGDDREMVKARTRFLSHGYYAPLQAALVELVRGYHPSVVIDAGCGEGYYTNRVKQETDTLLGFDLSKYAVDEACKARSGAYMRWRVFSICPCVMPVPIWCFLCLRRFRQRNFCVSYSRVVSSSRSVPVRSI